MYLPPAKAAKLVDTALAGATPAARLRASKKVLAAMHKIADHPDLRWDEFVSRYLRDCLEADRCDEALVFLEKPSFSANQKKLLLEPVVAIYLRLGMVKHATTWISTVSYVFGAKAVRALATKPGCTALAKNKTYLKIAGPGAELAFFKRALAEYTRMWARDDYDNLKDALLDARGLVKDARKHGKTHVAAATKHLARVTAEVQRALKAEPDLRTYLKGLL